MLTRRMTVLGITLMVMIALIGGWMVPATAVAQERMAIEGLGEFDDGECGTESPNGQTADFSNKLSGDLTGCLYVFVDTAECGPDGKYLETGVETFVGEYNGESGTFWTTFVFLAQYESCVDGVPEGQLSGGCYHPVIQGSGTGVFRHVQGYLMFIDDVEAGNFPFMGQLEFPEAAEEGTQ